uniref:Uncharacterized protein n=1 Tax=Arundo donax TaxID=35708 RepID=A0A0A9BFL3_ARUDO
MTIISTSFHDPYRLKCWHPISDNFPITKTLPREHKTLGDNFSPNVAEPILVLCA